MRCGYFKFEHSAIGKISEAQYKLDDVALFRMIDYVQSVIVSTPPSNGASKFNQAEWDKLADEVRKLYTLPNPTYHIVQSASI